MEKRTTLRLLVNVVVIIFVTGECFGKLVKKPDNKTVFEGQRTILECVTDFHDLMHTVFWKFENEDIFYGGEISLQYTSKFGIEKDYTKGIYNLIIPNATKFHNGRYMCADDEGEGEKSYAWVTVTESPSLPTTKANGNSSASTGTNTLAIVIPIVVVVVVATLVAVVTAVICIYKRKKTNRPKNGGLLIKVESNVQKQGGANVTTSAPKSTEREDDGVDERPNPNPKVTVKKIEEKILAEAKKTGKKTLQTTHGLKPKNPEQEEKEKLLGTEEEKSKKTTESNDNAAHGNAAGNVPSTSDQPQEDAEYISKLTGDVASQVYSEDDLLKEKSLSLSIQTPGQKNREDIEDKEAAAGDDKNTEISPIIPDSTTSKDNSS